LMGIDRRGRPTTELFTWADTRAAEETVSLRSAENEHAYHARTGCFFHASFWPAKLRWLQRTRPEPVTRTACWVGLGEYLYENLLGRRAISFSIASGTGLLDVNGCRWDDGALALSGIAPDHLPALHDWDEPMRGLLPTFARRWPELNAVPWFLPLGDGALANVGSACVRPQWFCATIGTSGALRAILERPSMTIPWGAWTYRLDRRRFVIGGALSEGGNVIRWMTDTLAIKHPKKVEAAAARAAPDAHGLTVLPFWAGERSPNWRGSARAVIVGLSLATQPADLMRAVMEAIGYQFGAVYDAMLKTVPCPKAVIATGGRLTHSPAWSQILADVLNVRLIESPEAEASSRGAALLALNALGLRPRLFSEAPRGGQVLRPRRRVHSIYRAARERQSRLYDLIFPPPGHPEIAPPSATLRPARRGNAAPSR
ncbi:MAG TPA: FGGY-family carbohydrate kinase, partial [Candidatus Limnocylindrales bacterium]|nr:FGGY-family carbohydrate kinase [Candidatus Limnocylindrales bacterium]